jgi:hypothetical protein
MLRMSQAARRLPSAGTDYQVRLAVKERFEQAREVVWIVGGVAVEQHDHIRLPGREDARPAGVAVAAPLFAHDVSPGPSGDAPGPVGRAVVHDDDAVQRRRFLVAQPSDYLCNRVRLVQGRDDGVDAWAGSVIAYRSFFRISHNIHLVSSGRLGLGQYTRPITLDL